MSGKRRILDFAHWPMYKDSYIRAFQSMIDAHPNPYSWKSGEEVFEWWMNDKNLDRQIEGQEFLAGWKS